MLTFYRRHSITLAWASAQIHCQCSVSDSKVELAKTQGLSAAELTTTGSETSFIPYKGQYYLIQQI
jgi:hypothetical protein